MQNGVIIWSGLRVKMALHTGVSNCEVDRSTGRVNYVCFYYKNYLYILTNTLLVWSNN